ncbi:hypothetical protein MCG01_01355 [Enterococcus hirae]|uniref:hypothetical protein n=1 Tax=Enterococcus TaxID=1350 RepID=UPI0015977F2F|nr:hypothetical protein [Enterococcus hirae]MCH1975812.1 hypothetical protein [Enterococcus hirae]QKX69152.1 hypothetical protein HU255_08550 [Enterococcus hirae]
MGNLAIGDRIQECKKRSFFLKDVSINEIPSSEGMFILFVDNIEDIYFVKSVIKEKGVNTYILNQYIKNDTSNILYIKHVKNLKKEIKKFEKVISHSSSKAEIIFNQIKDKSMVKVGYICISSNQNNKETVIDEYLRKYKKKPVMNMIFRSNDATPSWNGFNYQGFVTVLRVLELINSLSEKELKDYSVEIEKYEDFIIYMKGEAQEIFQVKAYVTERNTHSYIEACEKLIQHKKQVGSVGAKCYLSTAADIPDWDEFTYSKDIILYGYKTGKYINTSDIIEHIKKEIRVFFDSLNKEYGDPEVDLAFASISRMVTKKIDYLHRHRDAEDNEYRLTFIEFYKVIESSLNNMYDYKLFFSKLKLDEKVLQNLDNEISSYCKDCNKTSCEECPLKDLREIFEPMNRNIYAKVLDPTITEDETNAFITEVFSGIRILEILEILESVNSEILFFDKKHIYIANIDNVDDYLEKIIPSSITIKRNNSLTRVLNGVKESSEVKSIYSNSSILVNMKDEKVVYKDQKINIIPDSLLVDSKLDKEKSILPNVNFNLIKRDSFMERNLNNE